MKKGNKARKRKSSNQSKFSSKHSQQPIRVMLDAGTLDSIRNAKRATEDHLKYHFDYFAELAQQRSAKSDELKAALNQTAKSYSIDKWQRAVKYKYGLHPLCTLGSLSYIGGRFNTGSKVNTEVPSFPALYLAQDKDTALQEHLGQQPVHSRSALTPREVALTNPSSETIVSVSGHFDKIFDLTDKKNLAPFVELVKDFTISTELITRAKRLGLPPPGTVTTTALLIKTLLLPDWRQNPSIYDIPANSQIFGHLVYTAGIEGVLYLSKFTGKLCLAIFPRNFALTDSYIKLDDELPHENVPSRIDSGNWRLTEMDVKEIIK